LFPNRAAETPKGKWRYLKADFTRWPALMHEWSCDTAPVPLAFVHDKLYNVNEVMKRCTE
jgi:hypothetical protein